MQVCTPCKQLNTCGEQLSSRNPQKQRVGLVLQFVANEPHEKQRKYINALVTAYLIEFEQDF